MDMHEVNEYYKFHFLLDFTLLQVVQQHQRILHSHIMLRYCSPVMKSSSLYDPYGEEAMIIYLTSEEEIRCVFDEI